MSDSAIVDRIKALESKTGEITAEEVVSDAADPSSPLHNQFEWDDSIAGHKYRLDQARNLIRSVRLVISENKRQIRVIGYVKNPDNPTNLQGYINTARLRNDKDRARSALIREISAAEAAMSRAYDVAEAVGLSKQIEQIIAQIRNIKQSA